MKDNGKFKSLNPELFYTEGCPYPVNFEPKLHRGKEEADPTLEQEIFENFMEQSAKPRVKFNWDFLNGIRDVFSSPVAWVILLVVIVIIYQLLRGGKIF